MKLDVNALRYMSKDEFRVLTAVEMGQKNHEIVPLSLVEAIARLKHGGCQKVVRALLKNKLVHHDSTKYDGYRLTPLGYDYLAIKVLLNRNAIVGVGRQIGVGKESDVFECVTPDGDTLALKLHRLGRTSFRAVRNQRDYLRGKQSVSWLYLSRLAALKEFAFMKALSDHGFAVPRAVEHNRHAVLMSLVDATPLSQVRELGDPGAVYVSAVAAIERMAAHGLIHCDFNEFNLLVGECGEVTIIDFPQMVSTAHPNAQMYFDRDVEGVCRFFARKFGFHPEQAGLSRPAFSAVDSGAAAAAGGAAAVMLDVELKASGFSRADQHNLERFIEGPGGEEAGDSGSDEGEDDGCEEGEGEEAGDAGDAGETGNAGEGAGEEGDGVDGGGSGGDGEERRAEGGGEGLVEGGELESEMDSDADDATVTESAAAATGGVSAAGPSRGDGGARDDALRRRLRSQQARLAAGGRGGAGSRNAAKGRGKRQLARVASDF